MNKIFKIIKNNKGTVAVSELAKGNKKGLRKSILALSILAGISSSQAFATPVSIQGKATSENAVSIGTDSFATSIDGVATGKGSIATGNGFSRDDFNLRVQENQNAIDAVNNKEGEINNKNNQLDATKDAIGSLKDQIADLIKQQENIKNKIDQRDRLNDQKDNITNNLNTKRDELTQIEKDLANFQNNQGKNIYLNFDDVLNTLNWTVLNNATDTNAARNTVANELKSKIETTAPEIAVKYDDAKYRAQIDGFLNRQASRQGTYEYLEGSYNKTQQNIINERNMYNESYYKTPLNSTEYSFDENYKINVDLDKERYYSSYLNIFGDLIDKNKNVQTGGSYLSGKDFRNVYVKNPDQKELNVYTLAMESDKKQKNDLGFSYISNYEHVVKYLSLNLNLNVGDQNFKDFYNNLIDNNSYTNYKGIPFYVKTTNGESFQVHSQYDSNIGILTKIKDLTANPNNLVSTNDINHFKKFYQELQTNYNNIDWNDPDAAINLTALKASYDKVIGYNAKIDTILNLYTEIIEERKKPNADRTLIDTKTEQLMTLKNEVLDGISDKTNFIQGMNLQYTEKANEWLNYGKAEADAKIKRINEELKLYNEKDELIQEVTNKAKEIQKQYDDALKKLNEDKGKLDEVNKKIDELNLTESEKAVDGTKKDKEQELAEREADKSRLEEEIKNGTEELDRLKEELAKTSLKDLGERSYAQGSNAFASGNDSIAIGTELTVTANDGIGIGRKATVTGEKGIALGLEAQAKAISAIAIGANAVANNEGDVALGSGSETSTANPFASYEIKGKTYNFAGTNPTSVVSVGKEGNERQITNVAAGRISDKSTDAINGSQLYAVTEAIKNLSESSINPADISDAVDEAIDTKLIAGDNITIKRNEVDGNWFEISAKNTQSTVVAGNGVTVESKDNAIGTKDYTVSVSDTLVKAGNNVEITGNAKEGFTINAKVGITDDQLQEAIKQIGQVADTNTQSVTKAGQGVKVEEADNDKGTKDYTVSVKAGNGVGFDNEGNVTVKTGNGLGFDNEGNVTVKAGDGLSFDGEGNLTMNGDLVKAGDNVTVTGNVKDGFTISAKDTNTQSTVSANKGITVTTTDNADGTKNYAVSTKLGKGLAYDESGAITATGDVNVAGGKGVTITNKSGEQVIDVTGVTTVTEDGKVNKRSDLFQPIIITGDNKNTYTKTGENGEVQVGLRPNIHVDNSIRVGESGPIIHNGGIDMNGNAITNVRDGVNPTDAVNVRQLQQQGNVINKRIDGLADTVNKHKKRADAGIASTAAMSNIPQVLAAGKSGLGVGVGNRGGQTAVAVGYSRASDNGKHIIKLSTSVDTQTKATLGAGYMYQW